MWDFITDFADAAVTVPLAIATLIFLILRRQVRPAFGWAIAIGGCAGLIGAAKVLLAGCGNPLAFAGISSPSGHAAIGAAVYGSLAMILATRLPAPARLALAIGTALLVLAVAASRLALGSHTLAEVGLALAIGLAALAVFVRVAGKLPTDLPVGWLAAADLALIVLRHGLRWPTERAVHGAAGYLHAALLWCG